MNLKIESVNEYNNMIQEATDDMKIGPKNEVNSSRLNAEVKPIKY